MNSPLLTATRITKSYLMGRRTVDVLRGVDLAVERGEFVALRGASGAGKSTLLHLLGGLDLPNSGEIHFSGLNLTDLSSAALARWRNQKIGYVFQSFYLLPELDALENVCLPARMSRTDSEKAAERGRELLAKVGLANRMEHRPYELSGGEQQRVAIARALINHPEIVMADEPTGNLDSHSGQEIIDLLYRLSTEDKTTLIIATHDSNLAARAPRVIHLVDGQIQQNT